ncbi:hypothetical protein OIU76_002883 [Salix suchowensis]|nr:hypothetical protein OIU76_002883 [Salix suchowensis]
MSSAHSCKDNHYTLSTFLLPVVPAGSGRLGRILETRRTKKFVNKNRRPRMCHVAFLFH